MINLCVPILNMKYSFIQTPTKRVGVDMAIFSDHKGTQKSF